jgi:uncharacterized protein (DUF983 family)
MTSPFDRAPRNPDAIPAQETNTMTGSPALPSSGLEAMMRGARNRCPRCQEAKLFFRFLKPQPRCLRCGQDWTHQQADDFPAYVSIFITGHLMAPVIIPLVRDAGLSVPALIAIMLSLAMILMVGLLQPAKGAIIGLQWWFGMHGFEKERPGTIDAEAKP